MLNTENTIVKQMQEIATNKGYSLDTQNSYYSKVSESEIYASLYFERNASNKNRFSPSVGYTEKSGWCLFSKGYGDLTVLESDIFSQAMTVGNELLQELSKMIGIPRLD